MERTEKVLCRARSAAELGRVSATLHDDAFDVERVRFDRNTEVVDVVFRHLMGDLLESRGLPPLVTRDRLRCREAVLRIAGVRQWEVQQSQGIGTYTLNQLVVDSDSRLRLESCENMRIVLDVSRIEVELVLTGRELSPQTIWRVLFVEHFRPGR